MTQRTKGELEPRFERRPFRDVPPINVFTMTCSINGLDEFAASTQLDFELDDRSVDLVADGNDLGTLSLPQLDIIADFQLSLIKLNFNPQMDASFDYQGAQLNFSFTVTESFSDLASLVETTFAQLATQAWDVFKEVYGDINALFTSINQNLITPGKDFGVVMKSCYNQSLQQVIQLFQSIDDDVTWVAESLKVGFSVSDSEIASSMQQAGYGLDQIARALAKGLGTSPSDAAQIFYNLGYGANDILNALTTYFGQSEAQAQQIVNNIFGNSTQFCAANAFARLINAPPSDTDALQRVRTDLEKSPAGSKAQGYLQLYNQYSAQVHQLITTPGPVQAHIARDDGQQIWNEIVAAVQTAQSSQPATMPGADEQDAALDILSVMMQVDNDLGQVINQVMNDIWSYEGMTYEQFLAAAQAPHTDGDEMKRRQ